jgi:phosphoribosyl-ATP pyrophosphohydrolase/phosphoribosyl-AMP cyclohydrolase
MNQNLSTLDWKKSPDGLLPAVVQDARTARVLMLAYMNEESLRVTLATGFVTFFSRPKGRLWKKGETSGNTLRLVSASADCDSDAILVRAIADGPTCHTGQTSCFAAEELGPETLGELTETIRRRAEGGGEKSYTRRLLDGGVEAYGAKVIEEADEVVRAARGEGRQRTIEEAADVLYHLFVLLRGQGIELGEVAEELRRRRGNRQ